MFLANVEHERWRDSDIAHCASCLVFYRSEQPEPWPCVDYVEFGLANWADYGEWEDRLDGLIHQADCALNERPVRAG